MLLVALPCTIGSLVMPSLFDDPVSLASAAETAGLGLSGGRVENAGSAVGSTVCPLIRTLLGN